jgi:hypothetical protein
VIVLDYEPQRPYTQQRLSEATAQRIARDHAAPRHLSVLADLRSSSVRALRHWMCRLLAQAAARTGTRGELVHSTQH